MQSQSEKRLRTRKTEAIAQWSDHTRLGKIPNSTLKSAIDFWQTKGLLITRDWSSWQLIPWSFRGLEIGMSRYREVDNSVRKIYEYLMSDESLDIRTEYLIVLNLLAKNYHSRALSMKNSVREIYEAILSQRSMCRQTEKEMDVLVKVSEFLNTTLPDDDEPPF